MNYIKNILVITLLMLSMSGCGLYSNFEKSVELEVPDSLYNYIEATSDTTNLASLEWRKLFTDAKLQRLIELALDNNTDLNVARLNVEQTQVAFKTARLAYTPTLSLSADGAMKHVAGKTTNSYGVTAYSNWEIDIFGRLRNAKRQSKSALEQSVAYQKAVQTELVATVAINYHTLLLLDKQLDISLRTMKMWEENIRTMEAMLRAGRINNNSVLQSKANRLALESNIVSIQEQIEVAENNISTLLKITPQHIDRATDIVMHAPEELHIGLPLQLLANRPDVQMAEYSLAQSFYAVGVARASLYPSISLTGSMSYSDGSGVVTNPGDIIYNLAGSILQPIFNRRKLRGELEIAKLQQEQSLLQFNQAVLDAGAEVNIAIIECRSARERMFKQEQQIENLQKALRGAELLMKHGTSSYLEVLVAQQGLLSAELSLATSKFEQTQGVINLYRSLGGGVR